MIGLVIDFNTEELKKEFGDDKIKDAYFDLKRIMEFYEFNQVTQEFWIGNYNQGCLQVIYRLIETLKKTEWIRKCIRKIKVFKIKDYGDFSSIVKEK